MKPIIAIGLVVVAGLIAQWLFPWWSIAVVSAAVHAALRLSPRMALVGGFTAAALLWLGAALWFDVRNQSLLSDRIAQVFHLPAGEVLLVLTALLGGLIGGLSAMSGAWLTYRPHARNFRR